jgi:hypothetical protein
MRIIQKYFNIGWENRGGRTKRDGENRGYYFCEKSKKQVEK